MERKMKQLSLTAWTLILALFIVAVISLSIFIAMPSTQNIAVAEEPVLETVTVNSSTGSIAPTETETISTTTWYLVETAGHFKYAVRYTGTEMKFLLKNNFVVTDSGWASSGNYVFASEINGAVYDEEGVETGYNCTITFIPTNSYSSRSSNTVGGLFSTFAGTIRNVNFVFNGTLHALGSVKYGGFAGALSGQIIDCNMASSGTVFLYGNSDEKVVNGGGLIGEFSGDISNSSLTMSGTVDLRNYYVQGSDEESSQNNDAKDNKLFAGGIVGRATGGGEIENCIINIYGGVSTTDATKKTVLGFYNDDSAHFPAGGVIGAVNNTTITKSTITLNCSIYANGGKSTSLDGAISGGVCGLLENNGSFTLTKSVVNIQDGSQISARSTRQNAVFTKNGNIHKGGIVGRKIGAGTFQHNVVCQYIDSGLVDGSIEGEDYGDNDYKGILVGSGTMVSWNMGNFWLVRPSGDYTQKLVQNDNINTGVIHYLNIYGGGNIDTTIIDQQIRFEAKKYTSPFYNWLSNIPNNTIYSSGVTTPTVIEDGVRVTKYYFQPSSGLGTSTTVNAVFLTNEINVAGNLVQFANEMNAGLNQSWVTVNLVDDIVFEVGMPVINEFKGTFNGNNHTITFNSGSMIYGGEEAANVGMFGKTATTALIENLNVVFSGKLYAGTETEGVLDYSEVNVGVIVGENNGTLNNVSLTLTQGGLVDAKALTVNAGGIAGKSTKAITKSNVIIDGKFYIQGNNINLGGVLGTTNTTSSFTNMNIVVRGELLAYLRAGDKNASLGGFAGRTTGSTFTTDYFVITVKDVSNFKNDVLRTTNATTSAFGAIAGVGSSTKVMNNTWLTASYDQYMNDGENPDGSKVIRLFNGDTETYNINRIYINGGAVDCNMDITQTIPVISFSVPHDSSQVFTGWFVNYNCSTMVESQFLLGSVLMPNNDSTNKVYYSAVISSMIMSYDNLNTIAITTNAGQNYSGVEFILGMDITISAAASYIPIGTLANPFCGIFDGKNLNVYIQGGINTANDTLGLFGCIGEDGVVKQIQVTLESNIGEESEIVGGAIAAYNFGTIGQDSSSNKIIVNINKKITGNVVGGTVGINYGTVKNVEVNYYQSEITPTSYGQLTARGLDDFTGSGANGIGGGVVAFNENGALLKNAIVRYCVIDTNPESRILGITFAGTAYVGGLVGFNNGSIYSSVSEIELDTVDNTTATVIYGIDANGYSGTLIGYNDTMADIDAIWALYIQADVLALPNPDTILINGLDSDAGNRLVRYGAGNISTVIEDNNITQPYGGGITFKASETDVSFYNYITDMQTGEIVSAIDGAAGRNFSPTVTTDTKSGLSGITYYGVFVNTEIATSADLYAMAENINNGFNAYANYILNIPTSAELRLYPSDENYQSIGGSNPFVGNFNGNGYLIRLFINADYPLENNGLALFGTAAPTSTIQNFNFDIETGIEINSGSNINPSTTAAGFLVNINHGLITNVTINTTAVIVGDVEDSMDFVGGMAGYNDGVIKNSTINYLYNNVLASDYAGQIYGKTTGGIAGYNAGTIGSTFFDNVKVRINSGLQVFYPKIEGYDNVGGIAGINDGTVQNTNTKIYGGLVALNLSSYGGGIAGTNNAVIDCGEVRIYDSAKIIVRGSIGGIAGINSVAARIGKNGVLDGIYVKNDATIETSVENPITSYGGIASINNGNIYGVYYEQIAIVRANSLAGGIVANCAGNITNAEILIKTNARISANTVGGAVGTLSGVLNFIDATINGVVGRNTGVSKAGGIAGVITAGSVNNSLVYLTRDVYTVEDGKKGLLAGESIQYAGINTWAYAYNSIRTLACSDSLSGFNVLKIVGNDTVIGTLNLENSKISFHSLNTPYMWYSDISQLDELGSMANNTYMPDELVRNQLHHVSFIELLINNTDDLTSMYQYINAYDLFNGVMFKLTSNVSVNTTLQPIGTETNKFTGIFDGNYKTITFEAGGGIAGTEYSGLFGYASSGSILKDFIVQVNEDVILGAGTSLYAGVIVGKTEGSIENVGLNLASSPYLAAGSGMGGFAGKILDSSKIANCWAVIYNQSVPVVYEGGNSGVNAIGVLGSGIMKMGFDQSRFSISIDDNHEAAADFYRLFNNWYANISIRQRIVDVASYDSVYGDVEGVDGEVGANGDVSFVPVLTAKDFNITISFISLDINDSQGFLDFANNINTYSDQGASFVLTANIEVSFIEDGVLKCEPVGTLAHPFTGSFDGNGHTITIIGNISRDDIIDEDIADNMNVYTGLFGYVEETAVISNLIVRADYASRYDNPEDYNGQTIGDHTSIYTGLVVALLKGRIEQVIVVLQEETDIYNVNNDARGGLIGVVSESAEMVNSWVVLPEFYDISAVGGVLNEGVAPDMPNVLYQSGVGGLSINIDNYLQEGIQYKKVVFEAIKFDYGPDIYGFVDNKVINDNLVPEFNLEAKSGDALSWNDREIIVLFLDNTIQNYNDLKELAEIINSGRNYKGVVYQQTQDIIIDSDYVPIGGQIQISSGSVGMEYKMVEFIGGYNGNGYTITVPQNVTISGRYAGIFGITGKDARIRNLKIVASGTVGDISEGNSDYTRYAGFLIGLNNGASLKNIIVEYGINAYSEATIEAGRLAGATNVSFNAIYDGEEIIGWEGLNLADNCWVLVYNCQFNALKNNAEQLFNDTIDAAIADAIASGDDHLTTQGRYNGGLNMLTVIAAGMLEANFVIEADNTIQFYNLTPSDIPGIPEWYYYNEGVREELVIPDNDVYNADKELKNQIYYVSFLDSQINSLDELMNLAEDTNEGYDLYGLTFELESDIVIDTNTYEAIGGDNGGFNATFNGNGYRITIANGVNVEGKYAGVFGNVGEFGIIKNLIIEINGTLGRINYSDSQLENGKVKTLYAGAIAYTEGETRNVIVMGYNASLVCELQNAAGIEGAAGLGIGYDDTNLVYNSWVITKASNNLPSYGRVNVEIGESSINVMKVIGMGALAVSFDYIEETDEYIVLMQNDTSIEEGRFGIVGWYSDYEKDNQLSSSLGISYYDSLEGRYTPLATGTDGSYMVNPSIINCRYEVLIISSIITTVEQLQSIEADVNIGGYSFENLEFTLANDIDILSDVKIGTETSPFKGIFNGSYNGVYYTINLYSQTPLFGYNEGTLKDLTIILNSVVYEFGGSLGAIACNNKGTIQNSIVVIASNASMEGEAVGGITGINEGEIENCIVIIKENGLLLANGYAGGVAGINRGTIIGSSANETLFWKQNRNDYLETIVRRTGDESYEDYILMATVLLLGSIEANTDESTDAFAGGITGFSEGYAIINRVVVRIYENASIVARGANAASGGLAGRSRATLRNSVVINEGIISAEDNGQNAIKLVYCGDFIGDISGSAINSWLVSRVPPKVTAVGNGYVSVNMLEINGNGDLDISIDSSNTILFFDITEYGGAIIDGWYLNNNAPITDKIGNSNKEEGTFKPNTDIMGRIVTVVYINTQLSTVDDIITMAKTVNSGLYNDNILFSLQNDIEFDIANPLTICIGTKDGTGDYGFKHTFEGNGYTITFNNDSMVTAEYLGLFGFVAGGAIIRNLNVVYTCTGSANFGNVQNIGTMTVSKYFGGIAGENGGTIENCSVTIDNNCTLNGVNVGGIAGINNAGGRILSCTVTNNGTIRSESNDAYNAYAGGVAGTNSGDIIGSIEGGVCTQVTHSGAAYEEAVYAKANGSGSAYVGGIAGSNTNKIEKIDLSISNKIQANSPISGFAGGVAGSNTGNITRLYITIQSTAIIEDMNPITDCAGGIVGININKLSDILVNIATQGVVSDSAISEHKDNSALKNNVRNVWVYNNNIALNSKIDVVNSMTYTSEITVTHSDKVSAIIAEGIIVFYADLDSTGKITMFQNVKVPSNVFLSDIVYQTDPDKLLYTSDSARKGISAKVIAKREFSSGSEFKAFAYAHNSDVPTLSGEYSLGNDIVLPAGFYEPIGTAEKPFYATFAFNGKFHTITVGDDIFFGGLKSVFGYNAGTIKNLAVKYECSIIGNDSGGITVVNTGRLQDVVVYIEEGVIVSNPITYSTVIANSNAWVISENNIEPSTEGNNIYKVIVVNGDGALNVDYDEAMRFHAVAAAETAFAGWGNGTNIVSQDSYFVTTEAIGNKYSAEFLSTNIDTIDKLLVLNDLLMMNYDSSDSSFNITADFEIDCPLFGFNSAYNFNGIIDGKNHTLTITAGIGNIFGASGGEFRDIIFDHTTVSVPLFANTATVSLTNVVILNNHANASLISSGTPVYTADHVYIVTNNASTVSSANIGIILTNATADMEYVFSTNGISATAVEGEGQVFAGWFVASELINNSNTIDLVNNQNYEIVFINTVISNKSEFLQFVEAVNNDFTLSGYNFTITSNIVVDTDFAQIGSETTSFSGSLNGLNNSITISGADCALFKTLAGYVSNLIVKFDSTCTLNGQFAESISDTATLTDVVVVSNAAFATNYLGELNNCWHITGIEGDAVLTPDNFDELTGFNMLTVNDADILISITEGVVHFDIIAEANKYIVWYDSTDKAVDIESYDEYEANQSSGILLTVTSINEINTAEEFSYLNIAIDFGYSGNVTLGSDIVLPYDFSTINNYSGVFDGMGNTLDVSAINESRTIFGALSGSVQNMIFNINTTEAVALTVADGSGSVSDSAVVVEGNADVSAVLNANNVWLLTENTALNSGFTGYIYHSNGTIAASVDIVDGSVDFTASDNDNYYFMGYEINEGVETTVQFDSTYEGSVEGITVNAYYAPKIINNVEDWNTVAYAVNDMLNKASGKTFVLGGDIAVDATLESILLFEGTFNGSFKSVIFADESYSITQEIITLANDGAINNLAIVLRVYIDFALLPDEGVSNSWILYYSADAGVEITEEADIDPEIPDQDVLYTGGARLMQITDGGDIEISKLEAEFVFTTKADTAGCYEIRQWSYRNGAVYTVFNETEGEASAILNAVSEDTFNVKVWFDKRYEIKVIMEGVSDESSYKPSVTPTAKYWQDYAEDVTIERTEVGNGYLFWGFYFETVPEVYENALTIDVGALSTHITIIAEFEPFATEWVKEEYTGENITLALAQEQELVAQGYDVYPNYLYGANTPPFVDGEPYHVGTYTVNYNIMDDSYLVGVGISVLEITPKTLYFTAFDIERKTYDGSEYVLDANILNKEFYGFVAEDSIEDLDFSNVKFVYADAQGNKTANAGDRYIKVAADDDYTSILQPANDTFTYLNYVLDYSAKLRLVNAGTGEPSREVIASINRRPLVVSVDTETIEFLEQFEEGYNPVFIPSIPEKLVGGVNINYVCGDDVINWEDVFEIIGNLSGGLYRNAGEYPIGVTGSLSASNYIITLINSDAKYIIKPSPIAVNLDPMSMQYGDTTVELDYYITAEGYDDSLLSQFSLDLDYIINNGGELVPVAVDGVYQHNYPITVKYLASNINFVLYNKAELDLNTINFEFDENNKRVYLLETENILQVVPRSISVSADNSLNTKEFGAPDGEYNGRVSAGRLAFDDQILVIEREVGERVNVEGYKNEGYKLLFYVYSGDVNVTDYYDIDEADGYYYTITKTSIKLALRTWGSSTYVYGDISAMSNMAYSPVFNRNVTMESIFVASGAEGTNYSFGGIGINVRLGYFEEEVLNVGTYTAAIDVSYAAGKEYLAECIEFVKDDRNCTYEVIKRQVVVTLSDVSRYYNGSADISSNGKVSNISGIISQDNNKISVDNHGYYRLGTSANNTNAGSYPYTANCSLKVSSSSYTYLLDNYKIKVVNGRITINPVSVNVNVKIGYYEDGTFIPMKSGYYDEEIGEFVDANSMFFADKSARVYYEITNINHSSLRFLTDQFEDDATDEEIQSIIIGALRLQCTNPWLLPISSNKTYANATSLNSNVSANFSGTSSGFYVLPITLSLVDAKGIIKIGDVRPTIIYTLIAKNEYDQIVGNMTYNGETFVYNAISGMDYNYFTNTENVLKVDVKKIEIEDSNDYTVELDLSVNEDGEWVAFSDSSVYSVDNAENLTPQAVIEISEENGVWARLMNFAKENLILVSSIGGGLIVVIIIVLLIAAAAARKKKLLAAATRELISKGVADLTLSKEDDDTDNQASEASEEADINDIEDEESDNESVDKAEVESADANNAEDFIDKEEALKENNIEELKEEIEDADTIEENAGSVEEIELNDVEDAQQTVENEQEQIGGEADNGLTEQSEEKPEVVGGLLDENPDNATKKAISESKNTNKKVATKAKTKKTTKGKKS